MSENIGYNESVDSIVKCPYCKTLYEDHEIYCDGQTDDIICENSQCGKKFNVQCTVSFNYFTHQDCELNNASHKFGDPLPDPSKFEPTDHYRDCELCDAREFIKSEEDHAYTNR